MRTPKQKILGCDIAGRVEAVGKNVKQSQPGDEVLGGKRGLGGFAEYVCITEGRLAPKPANISFEAAAAVPEAAVTPFRVFAIRDISSQSTRFWSMARREV